MVEMIPQSDIFDIANVLKDCPVLPVNLIEAFLRRKGKTPVQIETILRQSVRKKIAYCDPSKKFLTEAKFINVSDMNPGKIKALWFMLDIRDSVQQYFIQNDNPHVLTFMKNHADNDDDPIFDVFYIQPGDENFSMFAMESKYKEKPPRKIFIIIENKDQIRKLSRLNQIFDIYEYLLVSADGKIDYIDV
jgi:hypothetical protein